MEFRVYAVSGSAAAPEDRLRPELHTIQISPSSHAINPLSPLTGAEGVVFKDINAPYSPGGPNSGGPQLKFKQEAAAK
jgi:hypothetical protein